MGYFIRFLLAIIVINFLIKLIFRLFFGWRRQKSGYNPYNQQQSRQQQSNTTDKKPESQEERILDFQRKSFESTKAEDADFVEIKDN